jgi:putative aldouronate transport system permease protein
MLVKITKFIEGGNYKMKLKKNGLPYEILKNRTLYLMILPAIVFFFVFCYLPMVGVYYGFTNYDFNGGLFGSKFVGLDNFKFLFQGGSQAIIWSLTKNTVLYNLAFIFIGNILQVITAIIISELAGKHFKKFAQSLIFLPYFISFVIVGVFIYNLFNFEYGIVNSLLKSFGMPSVDFYSQTGVWKFIIVGAQIWKGIGYGTIIYLAAITGFDRSIYEAADIDGANIFQKIKDITIPLLKPTFILLLLFSLGGILKGQFDLFYQIVGRNGNLYAATDIIDTYVYRSLSVNFDIGLGTAAGLYQSFFGMMLVLTVNFIIKKVNDDYALF